MNILSPISPAKYLPYLPTEAELKHEIEQDHLKIQMQLKRREGV